MKDYKRTSRYPSAVTRQKISYALSGRTLSPATRQKISDSLRAYWNDDSHFVADRRNPE